MVRIETIDEAEREASRRLDEYAQDLRARLDDAMQGVLPGNHSPAEAVLLAHLMTASDGYNDVALVQNWTKRVRPAWGTALGYLVEVAPGLMVPFAMETCFKDRRRVLAITIDVHRPGVRLPDKLQKEAALVARGYHVISLTQLEILTNPEECRERVECLLADLAEELLVEAGVRSSTENGL